MFRRTAPAPEIEQVSTPICPPVPPELSCAIGACSISDRLGATAHESEAANERYEKLVESAESFGRLHSLVENNLHDLKEDWFHYIEEKGMDRSSRRGFTRSKERQFAGFAQVQQQHTDHYFTQKLGAGWDGAPVRADDFTALTGFTKQVSALSGNSDKQLDKPREDEALYEAYFSLTVSQLLVRTQLAFFFMTDPQAARRVFEPSGVAQLPPSLQEVAALDINKGEDSVILQHTLRYSPETAAEDGGERLQHYIIGNGLPKEVRQFFQNVQVGAAAMNAATCPYNEFGLCSRVLARLNEAQLPQALLADMRSKEQSLARTKIAGLQSFAAGYPLGILAPAPKIIGETPKSAEPAAPAKRKSQPGGNTEETIIIDQAAEIEEEPSLSEVSVQIAGHDDLVVDPSDENQVNTLLDSLLATKMFGTYMRKHNFDGIDGFLRNCLRAVIFSPRYGDTGAIKALVDMRSVYIDGRPRRIHRLSGQNLNGAQGGKIGKDTRILFAYSGESSRRTVLLLGINNKENIKKPGSLRRFAH